MSTEQKQQIVKWGSLILAICVLVFAVIRDDQRQVTQMQSNSADIKDHEVRLRSLERTNTQLEEQMKTVVETLKRIERKIDEQ